MILIRPLIRANLARPYSAHVVIFFIILVGNVGGALSPLGDPPLFVGFLHGVDFFWTARNIWLQTAIVSGFLLALFAAIDLWRFRAEPKARAPSSSEPIRIHGINLPLIAGIIVASSATC
jgi:Na+/H+ antiporter NhaD/arsenite permease-like protein